MYHGTSYSESLHLLCFFFSVNKKHKNQFLLPIMGKKTPNSVTSNDVVTSSSKANTTIPYSSFSSSRLNLLVLLFSLFVSQIFITLPSSSAAPRLFSSSSSSSSFRQRRSAFPASSSWRSSAAASSRSGGVVGKTRVLKVGPAPDNSLGGCHNLMSNDLF